MSGGKVRLTWWDEVRVELVTMLWMVCMAMAMSCSRWLERETVRRGLWPAGRGARSGEVERWLQEMCQRKGLRLEE